MGLTSQQLVLLKAAIVGDGSLKRPPGPGFYQSITDALNQPADPPLLVWRTSITMEEIYSTVTPKTAWSWAEYIDLTDGARACWALLFSAGHVNPALLSVRAAWDLVFGEKSGQQAHLLAVCQRAATVAERVLADVQKAHDEAATLTWEGLLTAGDVEEALRL